MLFILLSNIIYSQEETISSMEYMYTSGYHVNLREKPDIKSKILGVYKLGARIHVLKKTTNKFKIGNLEDYWYFTLQNDKISGWIYGGFLNNRSEAFKKADVLPVFKTIPDSYLKLNTCFTEDVLIKCGWSAYDPSKGSPGAGADTFFFSKKYIIHSYGDVGDTYYLIKSIKQENESLIINADIYLDEDSGFYTLDEIKKEKDKKKFTIRIIEKNLRIKEDSINNIYNENFIKDFSGAIYYYFQWTTK